MNRLNELQKISLQCQRCKHLSCDWNCGNCLCECMCHQTKQEMNINWSMRRNMVVSGNAVKLNIKTKDKTKYTVIDV